MNLFTGRRNNPAAPGFTLLEVMVAMVLLAAIGMATYSWINASLHSLVRVEDHIQREQAGRNALAYMKTVNPMAHPSGESEVGPYKIRWRAEQLNDPVQGVGHPFGESLYELALYDTHVIVELNDNPDKVIAEFDVRQVGYDQTKEFVIGF